MEHLITKKFWGTPFTITCSKVVNSPGTWDSTKVSIYRDDLLVGEYIRNYSSAGQATFHPFSIGDQWYALYSADYTATRVMKINDTDIEDWCGEDSSAHGFCPIDMYIPRYHEFHRSFTSGEKVHEYDSYTMDNEYKNALEFENEKNETGYVGTKFCNFGFLCGCVWGDDSSWKLRYIDLSKVPEKELVITDKFGYWELPNNQELKDCINFSGWEPDHMWVELTRMEHVRLDTGERC